MQPRLTIGEFAGITHLSVKTLRRYHENGLLDPAQVDQWTGYRYYDATQIETAQTIRRLRELDLPIREIRDLLAEPDDRHRADLLSRHLQRLEERLEQTREAVIALRRLLRDEGVALAVERRTLPARTVAAVTGDVALADIVGWYSDAMAELDAAVPGPGTGPPGALYDNALFADELGPLTVYRPVDDPPTRGRVHPLVIPAVELAVTVHAGSHADIDITYGRLGRWVLDRGLGGDGPVHEVYLVGPRDTPHADEWRTEIGRPLEAEG